MAANPPQTPCVACGNRLPAGSRFCDECGASQPERAAAQPAPATAPAPAPAPPSAAKKVGSQTVIGIASPIGDASEIAKYARASHPGFAPAPAPPPPLRPQPAPDAQPVPQPAKKVNLGQTMVGMGSLPGADRANAPAPAPVPVAAPAPAPGPVAPTHAKNIPKGTLMGVALPGIAPTHDRPPPPQFAPPPAYVPQPEPANNLQPAGVPRPSRLPAIVLGLVALLALIGAAVYVFVLRPTPVPALTSAIEGDNKAPRLVVKCPTCADGSSIDLGGKSASFSGGAATIALAQKDLKVGRNVFRGKLVPKGKQPEDVELAVAIPFLVHPSLAPLEKGESRIDVVFELADDQKGVLIDGKKIEGTTYGVAIPAPTEDARIFDATVHYEVQPKTGASVKGSLKLAIPYASLRIGLPGRKPFAIGEELEVSGHTAAGGTVQVGETQLTADENGVFRGKVKIGKDGSELELRAYSSKLAPRTAKLTVTHAKDAAEVVRLLRAEVKTPFTEIAKKPDDHLGKVVAVKLQVAQTGEEDGRSIAVGDVKCGDEKCPAVRVLLPPGATAAKGDSFEVLGVLSRVLPVEQGKSTAVEIDASILIGAK